MVPAIRREGYFREEPGNAGPGSEPDAENVKRVAALADATAATDGCEPSAQPDRFRARCRAACPPACYTIPSSNAFRTARVRSRTPSFDRMFETWFLTVPSATLSELAISLLL